MKRFITAIVLIALIGIVPAIFYYWWLAQHVSTSKDMQALDYALYDSTRHDVIFLGASRVEVNIDPRVVDSITGLNTYALTIDGMGVLEYYMLLNAYLQNHPAPRYVVVSTDYAMFNTHRQLFNTTDYYPYLERDSSIRNILTTYNPLYRSSFAKNKVMVEKMLATTDARRLEAIWPEKAGNVNPQYQWPYYKGFRAVTLEWQESKESEIRKREIETREDGFLLLKKITELCRERNIQTVFFVAPEHVSGHEQYTNGDQIMQRIEAIADSVDVQVWNYTNHKVSTDKQYFYNASHLNHRGAKVFSATLAEDLNQLIQTQTR